MLYKRIISLLLSFICLFTVAATCFQAVEEEITEDNVMEEVVEETVEETEAPTAAPTMPPTEPPKPSPDRMGYAAYAKKLDETVYPDTDLGANYTKEYTNFKVWSPAADDVKVCVYKTGSDDEEGFKTITVKTMNYSKSVGTWYITLFGDYKNMYYTYKVTVGDKTFEVVDPYAKAVGVNGERGMIVDLNDTDPDGWKDDSFKRVGQATDAVVWEVSVRDFSASVTSGVSEKNRGKFLAFTEDDTTLDGNDDSVSTCVSYLKELGVNYVQINPFYDFASIDETLPLDDQYNWGYDPKNYNVPEGSYSSNAYDGRVRIKECKQMIQALHKAGIGVIMDVVYNHTYFSEDSFFNRLVPYYYHRINEDGSWSNGSGCGNDVATERKMVSKYIRESVSYWAKEYHIDGFRFDLMGLMDVDTMNGIRTDLNTLPDGDKILMYGEAWDMKTTVPLDVYLANQNNMHLLDKGIAAFNDTGRDAVKGSNFQAAGKGFVQNGSEKSGVRSALIGDGGGWADEPARCVNYVSCHDNLTLFDKLTDSVYGDKRYDLRREDADRMNRMAAAIVMMSRGMPFMLAGEELGRTKKGDENSYISPVEINQIDWRSRYAFTSLTDYYQGLIKIRKAVPALRAADSADVTQTALKASENKTIAYSVAASGSPSVVIAFNGDLEKSSAVDLPAGEWVLVADNDRAGLTAIESVSGKVKVPASSTRILIDKKSFTSIEEKAAESIVYLRYKDTTNENAIVCEERLTGKEGEKYKANTPSELLFRYDVTDQSKLSGTFDEPFEIIDIECEKYEGEFSTVTIKYLDADDHSLSDTVVMTNRVDQQYYTQVIPGVKGYALDLENLPENGAGKFTEDPIEVVYRYKKVEKADDEEEIKCTANIIYMADDGKILKVKSETGDPDAELQIDKMEFDGYKYVDISKGEKYFSETELNVILYYAKPSNSYLLYIVIAGAAVLLLGATAGIILGVKKKKKHMTAIDIEE